MRLWHEALIPYLPRGQLLGQHRECAALRGKGWGRPHSTVNYVFTHPPYKLFQYHVRVMEEMAKRGYHADEQWFHPCYRGKVMPPYADLPPLDSTQPLYPEHDDDYFNECLENLYNKGIVLSLNANHPL